ncbi:hypothetical protein [Luteolibacter soli]|uniref:TIR domain-containing protein n=1 Tax=Luteolibacter soli TaxID=3135280 RepID=A0ABU9AX77_9BACT
MPRPLHRWKSFWFGILTLAFLSWAWIDSTFHFTLLQAVISRTAIQSGQQAGRISLGWTFDFPVSAFDFSWQRTATPPHEQSPWPPQVATYEHHGSGGAATIAHWYLLLNFSILWAVFLAWRRQLHRMRQEPLEPTATDTTLRVFISSQAVDRSPASALISSLRHLGLQVEHSPSNPLHADDPRWDTWYEHGLRDTVDRCHIFIIVLDHTWDSSTWMTTEAETGLATGQPYSRYAFLWNPLDLDASACATGTLPYLEQCSVLPRDPRLAASRFRGFSVASSPRPHAIT